MWTKKFWKDAFERALKSAAQCATLAVGAGAIDAFAVSWIAVLGFALGGFILSILSSVASTGVGDSSSASMMN